MKKFITLCTSVLLAAGSVMAQTIVFQHKGETIANNSSISFGELVCEGTEGVFIMPHVYPRLDIYNTSSLKQAFTIEYNAVSGAIPSFCGVNGQCVMMSTSVMTKTGTIEANQTMDLDIYTIGDFLLGENAYASNVQSIPAGTCYLCVYPTITPSDKQSITLTIEYDAAAGITSVTAEETKPVIMKGNKLCYDLNGASSLSIYSISGALVKSAELGETSGSISLSDMPKGIYLYRLNGVKEVCGKIIVK